MLKVIKLEVLEHPVELITEPETGRAVALRNSKMLANKEEVRGYIEDALIEHILVATIACSNTLDEYRNNLRQPLFQAPEIMFIDEFLVKKGE